MQKVSRWENSPSVWGKAYRKVGRHWSSFRRNLYKRLYPFFQRHWFSDSNASRPPAKAVDSVFDLPEGVADIDVVKPRGHFRRVDPIVPPDKVVMDVFQKVAYEEGEQYVAELEKARIFCPATVLTKDHTLLKRESFEFNVYRESNRAIYQRLRLPKLERIDGPVALVASDDIQNYHHWMFFTLPRIGLVLNSKFAAEEPRFFINRLSTPFHFETLERLSIPLNSLLFCEDYSYVEFQKLLVTPTPVFARHTKFDVDFVRKTFGVTGGKATRRLYIARNDAKTRLCVNEEEVSTALRDLGFELVTLAGRSVAEQAKLLSEAEIVVAPHGAALTNIAFMNPGTTLIELTHDHLNTQFFWDLASRAQLRYSYMRTELYPGDDKKLAPAKYDFKVDVERLKQRVAQMLEKKDN